MISILDLWRTIRRPAFISASGLLLCGNVAIVELTALQLSGIQRQYTVLEQVREGTRSLLIGLLNAEAGVRGYIITNDDIYLTPYHAGSRSILDQTRNLRLLPLDAPQRDDLNQLTSQLDGQMQMLAHLVDVQRSSGPSAAGQRLGKGEEKIGLDTLRSSFENRIDSLSASLITLQRVSRTYQEVETYCVIFAAFWLYMVIFISTRDPG